VNAQGEEMEDRPLKSKSAPDKLEERHGKRPIVQEPLRALEQREGIPRGDHGQEQIVREKADGEDRYIQGEQEYEKEAPRPQRGEGREDREA
jgi:hypothetical protein